MPKQIRDLSCSVSSFKYQLDKHVSTIPDTPCIANYDNSLENSSHTNPHLLTRSILSIVIELISLAQTPIDKNKYGFRVGKNPNGYDWGK